MFVKAERKNTKVRAVISGPPGSGKTYTALRIARGLIGPGGKLALVDTETESAQKYADAFDFDQQIVGPPYSPSKFMAALAGAASAGYHCLIIDSLSHAWGGTGGCLDLADQEAKRIAATSRSGKPDSYAAWKVVTPIYNKLVQAILTAPLHVFITLRAKQEYHRTPDGKVQRLGMGPEMRDSFIYEADIEGMMTMENELVIGKTRCSALAKKVFPEPGEEVAAILRNWCGVEKAA